jgi:branched-subunit amino acid aminotransferase/4-amino-4-deoxychorismate lyase
MTPEHGCVCVNGRFSAPGEATISALDVGFLLGDGLFESLRASNGIPYLLDRHTRRFFAAADTLGFELTPDAGWLEGIVHETLRRSRLSEAHVRITLSRGRGGSGLAEPEGPPTTVVAVLPIAPLENPGKSISAVSLPWLAGSCSATVKSTSWQHSVLASRRVAADGASEGIYVRDGKWVLEGVSSNVFVLERGVLSTPPLGECLAGITRARVLELAAAAGIPTRESMLDLARLKRAELVFVTNAVQGLRSLASLEGDALGGRGGQESFFELCDLYQRDRQACAALAS